MLPAVFPAYVTGGLTASRGAWNASVVAEVASWGADTLSATGIDAHIAANPAAGDHPRIALGVAVMSLYVMIALNRKGRFLRELEDFLTEEEAERVLAVITDWGRYAEIFAFDAGAAAFSLENPVADATPR